MPNEGPDDVKTKLKKTIASLDDQEEVLFLVDLWGGTPFNQVNSLFEAHKDKWAIVAGMNLPMVIEAYASRLSMNTAREIAAHISGAAKEGVKIRPEELEPVKGNSETPAHQSNTGATGKLKYMLARIDDSRLLHGQIATAWIKATQPTRIIIVSDAVARDDLRKKLIQQAAPPGVKAHVSPANQMIKLTKDDRHFGGQRALLLFENPQDVVRAVNGGVPLNKINTGSMAHSPGKVQPNKVLAFSQERKNTIVKIYVVDQAGNKSKPTRVKIN